MHCLDFMFWWFLGFINSCPFSGSSSDQTRTLFFFLTFSVSGARYYYLFITSYLTFSDCSQHNTTQHNKLQYDKSFRISQWLAGSLWTPAFPPAPVSTWPSWKNDQRVLQALNNFTEQRWACQEDLKYIKQWEVLWPCASKCASHSPGLNSGLGDCAVQQTSAACDINRPDLLSVVSPRNLSTQFLEIFCTWRSTCLFLVNMTGNKRVNAWISIWYV